MHNGLVLQSRKDHLIIGEQFTHHQFGCNQFKRDQLTFHGHILLINSRIAYREVSSSKLLHFLRQQHAATNTVFHVTAPTIAQPIPYPITNNNFNILRPDQGLILVTFISTGTFSRNRDTLITTLVQQRNRCKDKGRNRGHRRSTNGVRQRNRVQRIAAIPVRDSHVSLTITRVGRHRGVLNIVTIQSFSLRVGNAIVTLSNTPRIKILRDRLILKVIHNSLHKSLRNKGHHPVKRAKSTRMLTSHGPSNGVTHKACNSTRVKFLIAKFNQGVSTTICRLRRIQVNSRMFQAIRQDNNNSLVIQFPSN